MLKARDVFYAFAVFFAGVLATVGAIFAISRRNDGRGNNSGIDEQLGKARSLDSREREVNRDEAGSINEERGRLNAERDELERERVNLDAEKHVASRDRDLLEELQKRQRAE